MSEDFLLALTLCVLGAGAITIAAVFAFKQKVYFDPDNNQVTEIEVPVMGKLKTNTPAIALCFLGAALGYFAADFMKGRRTKLVTFQGEVAVDPDAINRTPRIGGIVVGVTSGSWHQTATPTTTIGVQIPVPDSWPSYSAYAFALGGAQTRPALIGTSLEERKFKLRIEP